MSEKTEEEQAKLEPATLKEVKAIKRLARSRWMVFFDDLLDTLGLLSMMGFIAAIPLIVLVYQPGLWIFQNPKSWVDVAARITLVGGYASVAITLIRALHRAFQDRLVKAEKRDKLEMLVDLHDHFSQTLEGYPSKEDLDRVFAAVADAGFSFEELPRKGKHSRTEMVDHGDATVESLKEAVDVIEKLKKTLSS